VFACAIDDQPLTDGARSIQWQETGEVTKAGKKTLSSDLVTCAVDLGIRNLGFLTLATRVDGDMRILRARNQWLRETERAGHHPGRSSAGPDLAHIGEHKREIGRRRRLRGKPVNGEQSHVRLQRHIDAMGMDRFKKGARATRT
jgi:hypothetical protein